MKRIENVNPKVNAVVTLMADEAIECALKADASLMRGENLGPLHGVPFSIKDALDCAGTRTQRGSRLFADYTSGKDATVVSRMRETGAIPLFKSNLPEFSMSYETDNCLTGLSRNPWRLDRTSGGSSGGESAAIAAGMSPIGIGSDIAISLRGPAAHTGIAALKPTRARVSITGHWPEVPSQYWHVGPMARSVRDLSTALLIMQGADGLDPWVLEGGQAGKQEHGPLRVGWFAEPEFAPVAYEVVGAVKAAANALEDHGCYVEHIRLPFLDDITYADPAAVVFNREILPFLREAAEAKEDQLSIGGRERIRRELPTSDQVTKAQERVTEPCNAFTRLFKDFDVLLCPVVPVTAPPPGLKHYIITGETLSSVDIMDATVPFNLTGLPALCVPYRFSEEGLPIGVQLVANHFRDETILALGQILEETSSVYRVHPPL